MLPVPPTIDLTSRDIEEFRTLFRRETGKELDATQAEEYALRLIHLVALVARPDREPSDS